MAVSKLTAVLGTCRRTGRWEVSKNTNALVVFGRCLVDYRQASADPELERITIKIFCLFGALTMIMRPGTDVRPSVVNLLASSRCNVDDGPMEGPFPAVVLEVTTLFGRCRILSTEDEEVEQGEDEVAEVQQRRATDETVSPADPGAAAFTSSEPESDLASIDASTAFGEPEARDPVSLLGATVASLSSSSTALPESDPEPLPADAGVPSRRSAAAMFEPVRTEGPADPQPAAETPAFETPAEATESETSVAAADASMADLMFVDQLDTATSEPPSSDGAGPEPTAESDDEGPTERRLDALDPDKAVDLSAGPTIRITA